MAQNLMPCDPLSGDDCSEPERECDSELKKCVCVPGWIQPSGVGGQCQREQQEDECEAQTDVNCDRRGRGGPNPRSECIDREPFDGDGNPRQGYTCECLPPFFDAPNAVRGTNCLEPDPTPAPVAAIIASSVPSMAPIPPGQPLPCTTFVCLAPFSFCAAEQNRCVCQRGYIQSLGSPFACEEMCSTDTDCSENEHCFESRCTPCSDDEFREEDSEDGCVNPCISTVPDPCPASCKPSNSTAFTCLCEGMTDDQCPQDEECNMASLACQACPADMPFRNELSTDGCIDPCNPSMPGPPPCRAECEDLSATNVTCVCESNSDCLQDTECIVGSCQPCSSDGFFRDEGSTEGCVNPCQPAGGSSPCPSTCVSSSATVLTCQCPNGMATDCPVDETCTSDGACEACSTSNPDKPFRPENTGQCVESADCSAIGSLWDLSNNRCYLQGYCSDSADYFYDNCKFTFPTETAYKGCLDQAISIAATPAAAVIGFGVENNGITSECYVNMEDVSMPICPAGSQVNNFPGGGRGKVASGGGEANVACYIFDE